MTKRKVDQTIPKEGLINLAVRPLRQAQDRLRYLRANGQLLVSVRGEVSNHERDESKSEFP